MHLSILTVQALPLLSLVILAFFGVKISYHIGAYQDFLLFWATYPHLQADPLHAILRLTPILVLFVILLQGISSFQAAISVSSVPQLLARMAQLLPTVVSVIQVFGGME